MKIERRWCFDANQCVSRHSWAFVVGSARLHPPTINKTPTEKPIDPLPVTQARGGFYQHVQTLPFRRIVNL
ncbi:hypothetical protein MTP99_017169 [Tenebrio molitor]|nr:hypothetical protein MTP99_017169 [Tenebrio molitor]